METMERMEVSENPTENSMASGASWLEAAAAEAESTDREEQDPSAMAAMAAIYAAEKRWQETAETVEQHHSDLSKLIESKCQEVCQCVHSSNDALFGRLEVLFQEQAERQSQLQSKFDSIGEDETALCMARMARDIVQVPLIEPSPKPPSCRPALLSVPGAVMREDAICDSRAMSSVKSGGTDFSTDSSKDKHPSSVIQREDEEAYQAALVKAKRLQHQETKRLTKFISSGQDEHWRHKLREFMQTALMESICAGVIFTNSILIGIQTDYMARRIGEEAPLVFTVIDAGYTAIFGLELAVRLLASGVGFFYRDRGLFWNYLDNDDGGGSGDRMLSCLHNESCQAIAPCTVASEKNNTSGLSASGRQLMAGQHIKICDAAQKPERARKMLKSLEDADYELHAMCLWVPEVAIRSRGQHRSAESGRVVCSSTYASSSEATLAFAKSWDEQIRAADPRYKSLVLLDNTPRQAMRISLEEFEARTRWQPEEAEKHYHELRN